MGNVSVKSRTQFVKCLGLEVLLLAVVKMSVIVIFITSIIVVFSL
jgi:hypothetical protein